MAAWDDQKPEAFVDLFADKFVWRDLTVPEPMRTSDEAMPDMQSWFTALPDMQVRMTNRVIGQDSIAAEIEFTGTNTGPAGDGRHADPGDRQGRGRLRRLLRSGH